jgi:hypothetical protein
MLSVDKGLRRRGNSLRAVIKEAGTTYAMTACLSRHITQGYDCLQAKDAELEELQLQLVKVHRSEQQLQHELACSQQAAKHTTALTQELSSLINSQAQLRQELAASQEQVQHLQSELAGSEQKVAQLDQELAASQQQLQRVLAGVAVTAAADADSSGKASTSPASLSLPATAGEAHPRALNSWGSGQMAISRRTTQPSGRGTLEEHPATHAAAPVGGAGAPAQAAISGVGLQGLHRLSTGGRVNLLGLPEWGVPAEAEVRKVLF